MSIMYCIACPMITLFGNCLSSFALCTQAIKLQTIDSPCPDTTLVFKKIWKKMSTHDFWPCSLYGCREPKDNCSRHCVCLNRSKGHDLSPIYFLFFIYVCKNVTPINAVLIRSAGYGTMLLATGVFEDMLLNSVSTPQCTPALDTSISPVLFTSKDG